MIAAAVKSDLEESLSSRQKSHHNVNIPKSFLEHIAKTMPENLSLQEFTKYCGLPLRRCIRVNTLKADVSIFKQRLEKSGVTNTSVPWCQQGLWIDDSKLDGSLGNMIEHIQGQFYIQEASSMLPPIALAYAAGGQLDGNVLDMAAAPGSKTTQLAAMMDNHGFLVANELSGSRIKGLYSNIQRCGVMNVGLTHYDGRLFGTQLPEMFDAILLDAPCSGEGTVRKDPQALHSWSLGQIEQIAAIQRDLIESAFYALKPGGVLVYSTCTLNQEENHDICRHLLQKFGENVSVCDLADLFHGAENSATDEGYLHIWPQIFNSEGFFVAAFKKSESTDAKHSSGIKRNFGKFPFLRTTRKVEQGIVSDLTQQFGRAWPENLELYERGKELWLFPTQIALFTGKLRFDRIGLKLGELHRQGLRLTHDAAIAFLGKAESALSLTSEQTREFIKGRDIKMSLDKKQCDLVVSYNQLPIGLVRATGNVLKNKLPRSLVRDGEVLIQAGL